MVNEDNTIENKKIVPTFHSNERLLAFSDGIFAITITLLVLEIKVPEIAENHVATELPKELLHLGPKIFSHILSFIVMGIYWIAHHNMFIHIKRHNHIMLWLNTLFMMCIASLPFSTGLLGEYPNQQISVVIFASTLFLTGLLLNLMWWYGTTHNLVKENTTPEFIAFVHNYIRIAPILYLLAMVISFFNLMIAKFLFIVVAIVYIFPNPFHNKHYKQMERRFDQ